MTMLMSISRIHRSLLVLLASLAILGCATQTNAPPVPENEGIVFVDLQRFDAQLASTLSTPRPAVDVDFYDKVSPNELPVRLQRWLTEVEAQGGKIRVEPPPNDMGARSPLAALSLVSGLLNSMKLIDKVQTDRMYQSVRNHDVVIQLDRDPSGEVRVASLRFQKR
jgi:hypothetical protein